MSTRTFLSSTEQLISIKAIVGMYLKSVIVTPAKVTPTIYNMQYYYTSLTI